VWLVTLQWYFMGPSFWEIVLLFIKYVTDFSIYCEWSTISLQIPKSPRCVLLCFLCDGNWLQVHLNFEVISNHCWLTCIVQDVRLRDCYKKFSLHDIVTTLSRYARHTFFFSSVPPTTIALLLCHNDDNIDMYALLLLLTSSYFQKSNSSLFFPNLFQINLLTQIAKNLKKNPYCKKKNLSKQTTNPQLFK